jgi:hypothetical protein
MLVASNLALRFLLELAGLVAVGYVGFQLVEGPARWVTAFAAAAALAVTWMLVVAPKAANGIPLSVRELIGSALLLAVALGLGLIGQSQPAVVLATLVVVNTILLVVLGQPGTGGTEAVR